MKIFDSDLNFLGECDVFPERINGVFYVVPIAYEGPWCEGCKTRHTLYDRLIFPVCYYNESEIVLLARSLEDATNLPGFLEAEKCPNPPAQNLQKPTSQKFSHC